MRWAFFLAALFLCLSGCSGPAAHAELPETFPTMEGSPMPTLCLAVHGAEYPVTLRDSPSTRALVRQLPMTLTLAELNGNEKYARLPEALPTDAIQPGALQTGDLMLYGANCLVLFYQSFPSSYSYTPLGQIEHPDGLASVLGAGSVTVTLSILP
ncbi:MAG: cyclophilin-like fold protein [Eubacteriales bacterium]